MKDSKPEDSVKGISTVPENSKKDNGKNNIKKIVLIVVIGLAVLLLLGFGVFAIFIKPHLNPKNKVMLAFSKTFGQESIIAILSNNTKIAGEGSIYPVYYSDFCTLKNSIASLEDGQVALEGSITLEDFSSDDLPSYLQYLKGVGIDFEHQYSRAEEKAHQELRLNYNSFSLCKTNLYEDNEKISLDLPALFDGYVAIYPENFGKDYNVSALSDLTGEEIPEDYEDTLQFSPLLAAGLQDVFNVDHFAKTEDGLSAATRLYDAIAVEKTGETKLISIGGTEEKCEEYSILIPQDDWKKFLESFLLWSCDDSNELLDNYKQTLIDSVQDINLMVYLDSEGRLIQMSYQDDFNYASSDVQVDGVLTWHGKEQLIDETDGTLSIKVNREEYLLTYKGTGKTSSASREDTMDFLFTIPGRNAMELLVSNEFDLDERNFTSDDKFYYNTELQDYFYSKLDMDYGTDADAFRIDVNSLSLGYKGEKDLFATLSGDISFSPLTDDVDTPSGTEYNLLNMNQTELEDLFNTAVNNLKNISFLGLLF